jgi:hypothetical protein
MRLWSIHPRYLDTKGLVALWREALLAKRVLLGEVKGYRHHPQLEKFRNHPYPEKAIENYLAAVWRESKQRGYNFDKRKIGEIGSTEGIAVTRGQLRHEFDLLLSKLQSRDPTRFERLVSTTRIESHPMFEVRPGEIEEWEKSIVSKGRS